MIYILQKKRQTIQLRHKNRYRLICYNKTSYYNCNTMFYICKGNIKSTKQKNIKKTNHNKTGYGKVPHKRGRLRAAIFYMAVLRKIIFSKIC